MRTFCFIQTLVAIDSTAPLPGHPRPVRRSCCRFGLWRSCPSCRSRSDDGANCLGRMTLFSDDFASVLLADLDLVDHGLLSGDLIDNHFFGAIHESLDDGFNQLLHRASPDVRRAGLLRGLACNESLPDTVVFEKVAH